MQFIDLKSRQQKKDPGSNNTNRTVGVYIII